MENIEQIKKEIHENAIAHGWWETPRSFGEICALIHSELSEALEEYRDGKPDVYVFGEHGITPITPEEWDGEKPEGIAVELADAVIRILDYMGEAELEYCPEADDLYTYEGKTPQEEQADFGDFIARCHSDISDAYLRASMAFSDRDMNIYRAAALSVCIRRIEAYCERKRGYDLSRIIAIKHEYNKTRPYRHGGKRI